MDYQEAIELLKKANRSNDMVCILPKSDISKVIISSLQELQELYSIGIAEELREAVEKQKVVPAKEDGAFGECPRCGAVFNSELVGEYNIGYCPWCGQAVEFIDWSEENVR